MAAVEDKAKLVKFRDETESIITAQRRYRRKFNKSSPDRNLIRKWVKQFSEVGDVKKERVQEGLRFLNNVCVQNAFREFGSCIHLIIVNYGVHAKV